MTRGAHMLVGELAADRPRDSTPLAATARSLRSEAEHQDYLQRY